GQPDEREEGRRRSARDSRAPGGTRRRTAAGHQQHKLGGGSGKGSRKQPGLQLPPCTGRRGPARPRARGLRAGQAPAGRRPPGLLPEPLLPLRGQRGRQPALLVPLGAVRHRGGRGVYGPVRRRGCRSRARARGLLRPARPGAAVPPARVLRDAPSPAPSPDAAGDPDRRVPRVAGQVRLRARGPRGGAAPGGGPLRARPRPRPGAQLGPPRRAHARARLRQGGAALDGRHRARAHLHAQAPHQRPHAPHALAGGLAPCASCGRAVRCGAAHVRLRAARAGKPVRAVRVRRAAVARKRRPRALPGVRAAPAPLFQLSRQHRPHARDRPQPRGAQGASRGRHVRGGAARRQPDVDAGRGVVRRLRLALRLAPRVPRRRRVGGVGRGLCAALCRLRAALRGLPRLAALPAGARGLGALRVGPTRRSTWPRSSACAARRTRVGHLKAQHLHALEHRLIDGHEGRPGVERDFGVHA
ncbi:hypothetical protein T492DRAFT_918000, partial [Pavlovales sp. CCMP2436]